MSVAYVDVRGMKSAEMKSAAEITCRFSVDDGMYFPEVVESLSVIRVAYFISVTGLCSLRTIKNKKPGLPGPGVFTPREAQSLRSDS